MMRWLNGNTNSVVMSLSELREMVKDSDNDSEAWRTAVLGVMESQT